MYAHVYTREITQHTWGFSIQSTNKLPISGMKYAPVSEQHLPDRGSPIRGVSLPNVSMMSYFITL